MTHQRDNVSHLRPARDTSIKADSSSVLPTVIEGMTGDEIVEQFWKRRKIVCRAAFAHRAVRISVAFFVDAAELAAVVDVAQELAKESGQSRSGRSD